MKVSQVFIILSIWSTISCDVVFIDLIASDAIRTSLYRSLQVNRIRINLDFHVIPPTRPSYEVHYVSYLFLHPKLFLFQLFHQCFSPQTIGQRRVLTNCSLNQPFLINIHFAVDNKICILLCS